MSVTVYPKGTTIYRPERCYNGYTLFPLKLIDMNGEVVHEWRLVDSSGITARPIPRFRLLENGHVIVLRGSMMSKTGGVQEYDWDSRLVWEYPRPSGYLGPHHDVFREDNGNILLIFREEVPKEYREGAKDPRRREVLYSDAILEITPDKQIAWEWHMHEHLDIDRCNWIFASPDFLNPDNCTPRDWTHTNTVQALPENRWHDEGDDRFKPGNILISPRNLDTIFLVDKDSKRIVWEYTGDYKGGLSGQHEPHMIEKGLPGEGNILIFDNGTSPRKDLAHEGSSFVLEINPVTRKVVWKYEDREKFHSGFTSNTQRFPNGNTLINESWGVRIFEVTTEGEIVWEYVYIDRPSPRAYRYSYDHCPQTKALGRPRQMPVIPPRNMRVPPTKIPVE